MTNLIQRRIAGRPNGGKPVPAVVPVASPAPEDAWRALSLVADWIRHAESKATAALASAGLASGLLYTLVNRVPKPGVVFVVVAAVCGATITAAAVTAGIALFPRLSSRGDPGSLIYYREIIKSYDNDSQAFVAAYAALATDRSALFAALSRQVWANANVATRKYRAVNIAVAALMLALMLLAATAILSLLSR